jgi:hypothetical protein
VAPARPQPQRLEELPGPIRAVARRTTRTASGCRERRRSRRLSSEAELVRGRATRRAPKPQRTLLPRPHCGGPSEAVVASAPRRAASMRRASRRVHHGSTSVNTGRYTGQTRVPAKRSPCRDFSASCALLWARPSCGGARLIIVPAVHRLAATAKSGPRTASTLDSATASDGIASVGSQVGGAAGARPGRSCRRRRSRRPLAGETGAQVRPRSRPRSAAPASTMISVLLNSSPSSVWGTRCKGLRG